MFNGALRTQSAACRAATGSRDLWRGRGIAGTLLDAPNRVEPRNVRAPDLSIGSRVRGGKIEFGYLQIQEEWFFDESVLLRHSMRVLKIQQNELP